VIRDLEQWYKSEADCIGEVQSLIFKGENPKSGFNWLCLVIALLKASF
jgi:hypothetical protein